MTEIDYTAPVGQVRLLIADLELLEDPRNLLAAAQYVFTDAQIEGYLGIENGNVKRAASHALRAMAVSEAVILKVIKTDDKQTDGAKLGAELRAQADKLWAEAAEDDADDVGFTFIGYTPRPEDWAWH